MIRTGKKEDLPRVLELVKELALFERAPEQVINTVEMMEHDGFGPNPIFGFFVAEEGVQGQGRRAGGTKKPGRGRVSSSHK